MRFSYPVLILVLFGLVAGCQREAASTYVSVHASEAQQATLVKVDKSERRLYLMDHDRVMYEFPIALGGNPKGHKQQEGDNRTPEGRYVLDYKKEDSSYYRAFHISYPNEQDKASARELGVSPGGFIMIHGQPNGMGAMAKVLQQYDWTEGCIALTNEQMDIVMERVSVGTAIEIEW